MTPEHLQGFFFKTHRAVKIRPFVKGSGVSEQGLKDIMRYKRPLRMRTRVALLPRLLSYGWQFKMEGGYVQALDGGYVIYRLGKDPMLFADAQKLLEHWDKYEYRKAYSKGETRFVVDKEVIRPKPKTEIGEWVKRQRPKPAQSEQPS